MLALEKAMEEQQAQNGESPPTRAKGNTTANLDDKQDKQLVKWVRRVKELSAIPNITQITTSANQILVASGSEASISKAWINKFIKRLPSTLAPSKVRGRQKTRLEMSDIPTINAWYERLQTKSAGIAPANIYNFDESNWTIGDGNRTVWMFTDSAPPMIDFSTLPRRYCEWVTAIECVAADGWKAEPYLIIQGACHLDEWFQQPGYSDEAVLNLTPTGRPTPNAAMDWLRAFNEQTKDRVEEGQSRLLLFRGEPNFLTLNFIQFCDENSIIPFCFPPKMGNLMQPFTKESFEEFKDWWHKRVRGFYHDKRMTPDSEKTIFVQGYPEARTKHLTPELITTAFADRGIVPLNLSKMVEKVK